MNIQQDPSIHKDPHINIEDYALVNNYLHSNNKRQDPNRHHARELIAYYKITYYDDADLYVGDKKLVADDKDEIYNTINEFYSEFPAGRDKLFDLIKQKYYGISRRDVAAFLQRNTTHQQYQIPKRPKVVKPIITTRPFSHVEIDTGDINYITPTEFKLCIIQDHFTKYMQCYLIPDKHAKYTTKSLEKYIKHIKRNFNGKIGLLHSDNGKEFLGEFQALCEEEEIKHITGYSYKPSTQGLIERAMKTIKGYITRLKEDDPNYVKENLPKIIVDLTKNYNNSKHSTINMRPIDAAKGTTITLKQGNEITSSNYVHKRIIQKAKKMVKPDKIILEVGDEVRISLLKNDDYQHVGKREGKTQIHYMYFPMWSEKTYFIEKRKKTIYDTFIYLIEVVVERKKPGRWKTGQVGPIVQRTRVKKEYYIHQLQLVVR